MSKSATASSSGSRQKVNLRSTAVKRIMQEANELSDPSEQDFVAAPLETDIFEWHCTMRGVADSEFDGGLYHLRILLPPSYPMSAPDIILLTPNGRFELGKKICIDGLTSFHAGSWQPAWGVRTAILGLRSFWMQGGEALSAIGALDCSKEERKRLAKLSKDWVCPTCECRNSELLPDVPTTLTTTLKTVSESSTAVGSSSEAAVVVDELETVLSALPIPPDVIPPLRELPRGIVEDTPGDPHDSPPASPTGHVPQPHPTSDIPDLPAAPITIESAGLTPHRQSPTPTPTSHPNAAPAAPPPTRTVPAPLPIPVPVFSDQAPTIPSSLARRRGVPLWLDALICACFSMLVLLVARKAIMGGGRDEGSLLLRDDL